MTQLMASDSEQSIIHVIDLLEAQSAAETTTMVSELLNEEIFSESFALCPSDIEFCLKSTDPSVFSLRPRTDDRAHPVQDVPSPKPLCFEDATLQRLETLLDQVAEDFILQKKRFENFQPWISGSGARLPKFRTRD